MAIDQITGILDKIPMIIEFIRNILQKAIGMFGFEVNSTYAILIGLFALVVSYIWIKQWITTFNFRLATILNYILLALLIYITLVYV